jgi:peptide deformylase
MAIIQDKGELQKVCSPCSLTQGQIFAERLFKELANHDDGIGLAAPQLGIDARVCVVKVKKPLTLINPRIVGKFEKSFFQEGCLSFPGDYIVTERWMNIVVSADNHKNQLVFSFDKNPLECVCVQHEIDHLNGITMHDRQVDLEVFNGEDRKKK